MLILEGVHASYGSVRALNGVCLEVPDRSVVALLGANGAGKSTTLKTISGVLKPAKGRIVFDGEDISRLDSSAIVRRGVVHCPEARQVFPGFSVRENLMMGAYARGRSDAFDSMFRLFPILKERLNQHAGTLSGGEQQMLAIARALMAEPKLLMLDEPSLGLAPVIVEQIFDIIASFRNHGVSVLLVEQNAMLALDVADFVYTLSHGTIQHAAPTTDLRDSTILQRAYLGETL